MDDCHYVEGLSYSSLFSEIPIICLFNDMGRFNYSIVKVNYCRSQLKQLQ